MADVPIVPSAAPGPCVHDVGPAGVITVGTEADDVRIRGVDGTEVRVLAPADGAGIETVAEPGRFTVRTAAGARNAIFGIRIGGHGLGLRSSGTIELEVPRDALLEVRSSAGDVALRDVRGDAAVRTTSGDVSVKRGGGRLGIGTASGDVQVEAVEAISLETKTVSGDVRARALRFERATIETMSGDVELAGSFAAAGPHGVSTVSGDVELALVGGLTLEAKTVSGDVECSHPDRRSGDGRRQPLVIGDGAAHLAIRSMSGDVEIRAGRAVLPADGAIDTIDRIGAIGATDAIDAAARPAPTDAPGSAPVPPPTAAGAVGRPGAAPVPGEPAAPRVVDGTDDDTLAVLEALARGEIDVVEAERRLAGTAAPEGARDA